MAKLEIEKKLGSINYSNYPDVSVQKSKKELRVYFRSPICPPILGRQANKDSEQEIYDPQNEMTQTIQVLYQDGFISAFPYDRKFLYSFSQEIQTIASSLA